jgi:hypothetical protein
MAFKIPLAVYLVVHPSLVGGQELCDFLYTTLNRDPSKPLTRSIGIPVYFRNATAHGKAAPMDVDFDESEYTAIVVLISTDLMLDEGYKEYVDNLIEACHSNESKRRLYPVSLHPQAHTITRKLSPINFIRVEKAEIDKGLVGNDEIKKHLKSNLLHELCRLLLKMKRGGEEKDSLNVSPPIKLFISHSKHDETRLNATELRDYIYSKTQLKTFFDANDIAYGSNFGDEIKNAVVAKNSALIIFQSDTYSEREWCRIEAITAKSANCPIVIVNAIKNRERRTFPYLGNCPSIRFNDNFGDILDQTLEQVLGNLFRGNLLDKITDLYGLKTALILSNPPELFDFIKLKSETTSKPDHRFVVIYPDPPLGTEELNLLEKLDNSFFFITPLSLPTLAARN